MDDFCGDIHTCMRACMHACIRMIHTYIHTYMYINIPRKEGGAEPEEVL